MTLCFETQVARVQPLSPSFTRVTLSGESLARFDGCGSLGPRDLRVKVIVPVGGRPPAFVETGDPGWYQRWLQDAPERRGEMRTYTVRAVRLDAAPPEIDVDFVLHSHDGRSGPAATWARSATVGDRMLVLGPAAACADHYGGIEWQPPSDAGRVLLVGDETAVPAVGSILSTLPGSYVGHAILEVPVAEDFLPLRSDADIEVTWLARSTRLRGQLLARTVRDVVPARAGAAPVDVPDVDVLWETSRAARSESEAPYAWVAGEAGVVKELRRYLVGAAGLPRSGVAFMGYWREGRAS